MSLKKTAAEAEAIVLAFTDEQRGAVVYAFTQVQEAVRALQVIPEPLFNLLGLIVAEAIGRRAFRASWVSMTKQVIEGAPTLLGPHQQTLLVLADQQDNPSKYNLRSVGHG